MPRGYRIYCTTEASNVYVYADSAPTTCPNNAGHTVVSGSVSIFDATPSGGHFFGDGSDGDVTISTSVTPVRDMYYRKLTLTSTGVLNTAGYRIFVSDTLALDAGWIFGNGGSGLPTGTAGGVPFSAKTMGGAAAGGAGQLATGSNGGSLTANTRVGGLGGAGGAGTGGAAGVAGSGTVVPETNGGYGVLRVPAQAIRGRDLTNVQVLGGTGGSGGGGSGTLTGGGGGGGGGVVMVAARNITWTTGKITANGGDGGAGQSGTGGGGGGGGGCVIVITTTDISTLTVVASGGVGGIAGNAAGSNGSAGQVFKVMV